MKDKEAKERIRKLESVVVMNCPVCGRETLMKECPSLATWTPVRGGITRRSFYCFICGKMFYDGIREMFEDAHRLGETGGSNECF